MSGLNLTSLLDITFSLLIAFMMVTPVLTHDMNVELPEATAPSDPMPPPPNKDETIVVSVQYGGAPEGPHPLLAAGKDVPDLVVLQAMALDWTAQEKPVALEIDWRVPYGTYIQVAAALQRGGVLKYRLIYKEPS